MLIALFLHPTAYHHKRAFSCLFRKTYKPIALRSLHCFGTAANPQNDLSIKLRAKALLLLFTVYGLRSSEVINLRLEDFDWQSEVFTVRRAKHGGTQQYPIQYEVGEAILKYLQYARPRVNSRHVFLGERRPWGPLLHATVWRTTSRRMRALGIEIDRLGPHALRHACATRLLQKGSSHKEIADFLGHRDTKSVSIYAKFDTAGLRKVAAFGLTGLQ